MSTKSLDASHSKREYARNTKAARETRAQVAAELLEVIGRQAAELLNKSDAMGGRALVADRIKAVAAAERRGDQAVVRGAWMDVVVAAAMVVADLDYVMPTELAS